MLAHKHHDLKTPGVIFVPTGASVMDFLSTWFTARSSGVSADECDFYAFAYSRKEVEGALEQLHAQGKIWSVAVTIPPQETRDGQSQFHGAHKRTLYYDARWPMRLKFERVGLGRFKYQGRWTHVHQEVFTITDTAWGRSAQIEWAWGERQEMAWKLKVGNHDLYVANLREAIAAMREASAQMSLFGEAS